VKWRWHRRSRYETFEVFTLYGQPGRVQLDVSRMSKAQRERLLTAAGSWFRRVISWRG
jgi:hypothetical protein